MRGTSSGFQHECSFLGFTGLMRSISVECFRLRFLGMGFLRDQADHPKSTQCHVMKEARPMRPKDLHTSFPWTKISRDLLHEYASFSSILPCELYQACFA